MAHLYQPVSVPSSSTVHTTISPRTGQPLLTRPFPSSLSSLDSLINRSHSASLDWRSKPLSERIRIVSEAVDALIKQKDELAKEISEQMGRPISQCAGEIGGFEERAKWLISKAETALKDESVDEGRPAGLKRVIRRQPLGVCLLVGAWNFPCPIFFLASLRILINELDLIQVNALIPALLAGNSVLLKPSPQTPACAERIASALYAARLPTDVCQVLHLTPEQMDHVVAHPKVPFVSFTGSVANGKRVERTAAVASEKTGVFKTVNLELGGKDAAYVRADSDPKYAAENVVDAAFFNSGQSCCAVERVYVHESIHDAFVEEVVKVVNAYKLGDPLEKDTTLGPVVSLRSAETIRSHIADALTKEANPLIDEKSFPFAKEGTTYVAPQVLVDVDHSMQVMTEETFGPIVGIQKVKNDGEALSLINDSPYGLTCSIWTRDEAAYDSLVDRIDVGTVFLNRADYLDPALPWTGVKESGRGISLSRYGFDAVTRAKSLHARVLP